VASLPRPFDHLAMNLIRSFAVETSIPPSVNHYWKPRKGGKGFYLTKRGKEYGGELRRQIIQATARHVPPLKIGEGWWSVSVTVYCVDGTESEKTDVDNVGKAVLDPPQGLLYEDDSQVVKFTSEKIWTEEDNAFAGVAAITFCEFRERCIYGL